jgi:hypothetical protein
VSRPPNFDELVDGIAEPEERERLRRVHELLVEAGPPAELSPALASAAPPVQAAAPAEDDRELSWLPRRRLGAALVLVGAVLAATFGLGYLVGGSESDGGGETAGVEISLTAPLTSAGPASGVVNVGRRDADGNWPLILTVRGLPALTGGDYYTLALAKRGKPIVTCGTFNVADRDQRTLRMLAAYNLKSFDGWIVTRWDADTRHDTPVLWTQRT